MAWQARVPFRLPPWLAIEIGSLDLGEVEAEIVGAGGNNSLVARNIPTEVEARALVPRLAEALRRLALETGWAVEVSETIQELKDVGEADAATADIPGRRYWGDWAFAVVYSDDQPVGLVAAGEVCSLQTMSAGNAANHIRAAGHHALIPSGSPGSSSRRRSTLDPTSARGMERPCRFEWEWRSIRSPCSLGDSGTWV